jgi:hypothetical protein
MPDKLGPKFDKCFIIGYPREIKGYYFYHKLDNKVFVVRHGVFLEEFLSKEHSGSELTLEEIQDPHSLILQVKPKWKKFQARLWNKFSEHHVSKGQGE